jgi:fumarylacetoacetase
MGKYRDKTTSGAPVVFGQSRAVDYELEFAAVVGKPLAMRQRLKATEADDHIFGFVVLNDWSGQLSPQRLLRSISRGGTKSII